MSQFDLPTPDETWSESALRSHQVMTEKLKEMSKQVELLTGLVDQLQRQLKLNSKTSCKPPSSDRERRAPKPKKKSDRAKGGQKGRKGSTRILLEPHEVIQCEPIDAQCECGGPWVGRDTVRRLQVTELPEVQPIVTEYQERCMSCEHCGRKTYAGVQLPLGESRFGPRLHAFVVSLNLGSRLSLRQIQRLLKQSFNLSISVGAINYMIKRTAQHTQDVFDELRRWFQGDSSPKHVDETGWRVHGERTQLIGSLSQAVALYQCSKQRKADDVRRLIGDDLSQLIICDRAFVYHPWKRRQLC